MSRFRVYIKPFKDDGTYDSYQEVTEDVVETSLSSIKRDIDSGDYDAGVFKFSNFGIALTNEHGKYSDVEVLQSIFKYKVSDSVIKIDWDANPYEAPQAGQAYTSATVTVFEGLLNDEASTIDIKSHDAKFKCMGFESLLNRMTVPYSILSAGDTFKEIIYDCLNQAPFTDHVTVSLANIDPNVNSTTDAVAELENMTVKEALDLLLLASNSVLHIENNIVYVSDRTESATSQYTFYGQASDDGIENIADISNIRRGINRVFNFWSWKDSSNSASDTSSIDKFGARKKEVDNALITTSGTKDTILTALKNEFRNPKQELDITVKHNIDRFGLKLLDKVNIDYPTVFYAPEGGYALYGQATYGTGRYAIGEWALKIDVATDYKIMGIGYNIKNGTITYRLREA